MPLYGIPQCFELGNLLLLSGEGRLHMLVIYHDYKQCTGLATHVMITSMQFINMVYASDTRNELQKEDGDECNKVLIVYNYIKY